MDSPLAHGYVADLLVALAVVVLMLALEGPTELARMLLLSTLLRSGLGAAGVRAQRLDFPICQEWATPLLRLPPAFLLAHSGGGMVPSAMNWLLARGAHRA